MKNKNNNKDLMTEYLEIIMKSEDLNNPLLSFLKVALIEAMEIEANRKTGRDTKGQHIKDNPKEEFRSGYRDRKLKTPLGELNLKVPKFRNSGYIPSFLRKYKRSDLALEGLISEIYVNGLSTRKIEKFADKLELGKLSTSEVSLLNKKLDAQVDAFRNRRLDKEYPILYVDALYEKIRDDNYVRSMACMVVKAVNYEGKCSIIAIECMENESEETYMSLFENLKKGGLERVWLVVSDCHKGLRKAITKSFVGSSWQRCKVHFMRNITSSIPKKSLKEFLEKLKKIWEAKDIESSRKIKNAFVEEYKDRFPKAISILEEGYEDSVQYYRFDKVDPKKISSTNTLERLNREIRRRSKVVGVFPSQEAFLRLITSYLIEYTEDWESSNLFIPPKILEEQKNKLNKEVA